MDIQSIKNLIQAGNIDKAIDQALVGAIDSENQNALTLLKGRLSQLGRSERLGLLSYGEIQMNRNQITNSLLEILDEMSTSSPVNPSTTQQQANNNAKGTGNGGVWSTGTGDGGTGNKGTGNGSNKILFLASNPTSTARLQLDTEYRIVSQSLQAGNSTFQLVSEFAVTPDLLQFSILKNQPRIVHFSGHGMGEAADNTRAIGVPTTPQITKGIVLQDEMGQIKLVTGEALQKMFGVFLPMFKIDAVILNACYSEEQAKAISTCIPFVIGMNTAVQDDSAIKFSSGFYSALSFKNDIPFAFEYAKSLIDINGLQGDNIPVLYRKG